MAYGVVNEELISDKRKAGIMSKWQPIETAPKNETRISVRYEDGTEEDEVYFSDTRYCMIGAPMGSCGPEWVSTEAGNLPVDDPTHWKPTE